MTLHSTPTVLVVDDEELMREVVSMMIEDNGGTVYGAVDGVDALKVFDEHADEITMVLLDFSMPRMNGFEACSELMKRNPSLKFIMISGLAITPEVETLQKQGKVIFMSKPFHESELIKVMNELLETE